VGLPVVDTYDKVGKVNISSMPGIASNTNYRSDPQCYKVKRFHQFTVKTTEGHPLQQKACSNPSLIDNFQVKYAFRRFLLSPMLERFKEFDHLKSETTCTLWRCRSKFFFGGGNLRGKNVDFWRVTVFLFGTPFLKAQND